jgi:peptidoglycan hydrolase-like protein with peptidoglycan-binding domain
MAYGDKEGAYFDLVRRQFVAFQRGDSEQIPAKPTGGDALQIYKRAMLNAALNASGNGYGSVGHKLYAKYFGTMYANEGSYGVNEKGEYDENLVALLDEDKDGEIEHHFGSVGDKAKVPAGKGYEFAGAMAIASAAAKTYKAFEAGRRATPAEMAVDVTGWQDGLKKKYGKTYDTGFTVSGGDYDGPVISTINKAMGDNSDRLSLPSSFKAPGLVDAPGLPKTPATPAAPKTSVPKTDGSLSYIPGLSGSAPLTVPYAPGKGPAPAAPTAPAPAPKASAVTKFTKDENGYDVAFGELFGERAGTKRVIFDYDKIGLAKLKSDAEDIYNATNNDPSLKTGDDVLAALSKKLDAATGKDKHAVEVALAAYQRALDVMNAQAAGKTSLPGFATLDAYLVYKDAAVANAKKLAGGAPAPTQQTPTPAPTAPAAPAPDAAADAPEAPAKVSYKKAKLLPTSALVEKNLALYDDDLVTMAAAGKYLERGSHWLSDGQDGEMSKANQALIQKLELSLDRVNEAKKAGDDGSDDGVYGGGVEKAVRAIQRQYGLVSKQGKADGKAGIKTITALQVEELKTILDAGGSAKEVAYEVKDIQTLLGEGEVGKLANGQRIPAKVKAEIAAAMDKIETEIKPAADSELADIVTKIRTKAGIAKA